MSRSLRQLRILVAVPLVAMGAAGCSTDMGLNAIDQAIEAAASANKPMPHDSLFVLHPALLAQHDASLTLLSSDAEASFAFSTEEILGTNLKLQDDPCKQLLLPFPVFIYGVRYTGPYVCPNGNVSFNGRNNDAKGRLPYNGLVLVAPATADWVPDLTEPYLNNVYWQVIGDAPNRRLVITWHNLRLVQSALNGPRSTFRLILHETSNLIEFQYPSLIRQVKVIDMRAGISNGSTAIVIASGQQFFDLSGTSVCFTPAGTTYTVDMNPCPRPVPPNSPPVADPLGPYTGTEGSPVYFNGLSSYDVDGDPFSFFWEFGDGGTATSGAPWYTYADEGEYPVKLTVTDPHETSGEAGTIARISNVAPLVSLSPLKTITSGETAELSATFSDPGVEDAPWKWSVDWGSSIGRTDGGESLDQSAPITVQRQVFAAGTHTVTLTVEDEDGGLTTRYETLVVNRLPLAVDLRPGDDANVINRRSQGKLWVAILTTETVDASTVLVGSVTFGGASVGLKGRGVPRSMLQDANADGRLDLWLEFDTQDVVRGAGLTTESTSIELRATLTDGREAGGADAVQVNQ